MKNIFEDYCIDEEVMKEMQFLYSSPYNEPMNIKEYNHELEDGKSYIINFPHPILNQILILATFRKSDSSWVASNKEFKHDIYVCSEPLDGFFKNVAEAYKSIGLNQNLMLPKDDVIQFLSEGDPSHINKYNDQNYIVKLQDGEYKLLRYCQAKNHFDHEKIKGNDENLFAFFDETLTPSVVVTQDQIELILPLPIRFNYDVESNYSNGNYNDIAKPVSLCVRDFETF